MVKKYLKVRLVGFGGYTQPIDKIDVVLEEIGNADVGEKWELEIIEMEEDEYNKLPEFAGY